MENSEIIDELFKEIIELKERVMTLEEDLKNLECYQFLLRDSFNDFVSRHTWGHR